MHIRTLIHSTISASLLMALTSCSDASSTTTNSGPVQTAALHQYEAYEDYAPVFSADATKAAFLSNRTDGSPLAYFYDASQETKLVRLDDKLGLDVSASRESTVALNNAGSLIAVSRVDQVAGTIQLIVAQPSGAVKATLDLPAEAVVSELAFARGSDDYLAYVQRVSGEKTLKVLKVVSDTSSVTLTEIGSFAGQSDMKFALVNAQPRLLSFSAVGTDLTQTALVQSYDPNAQAWTEGESFGLPSTTLDRAFDLNSAGLFSLSRLSSQKIRNKQGTGSTVGQDISTEKVVVSDAVAQKDLFASGVAYDFASANYLPVEPLTVSSVSGTLDGQYLLLAGLDSFTCVSVSRQLTVLKLVRASDMKTVTLSFARAVDTLPWTEVVTSPCKLYDDSASKQYDSTITRAELIGLDGDSFLIALHSFVAGDEELRLAKLKVDFDAGTASDLTITEVSANSR